MSIVANLFGTRNQREGGASHRLAQEDASSWDVVLLSFSLLYQRIQFWIRPNLLSVLLSLPVLSGPAAKAALYETIAAGLRDPEGTQVRVVRAMKAAFRDSFFRALALSLLRWAGFVLILFSIVFWVQQDSWALRVLSIIGLHALVMWWLASVYCYAVLAEARGLSIYGAVKRSLSLAFRRPFDSLLFALIRLLLLVLGLVLLGPVMLVIPALRAILSLQAYWFITGEEIPGFVDPVRYARKRYDTEVSRGKL
jgi:uncharacterized membrane protein YesL